MAYTSRLGRRPNEYASKSAHSNIIKDKSVQAFLDQCNLPKYADDISLSCCKCHSYKPMTSNPISHIIAIDGGYNEISVRKEFPSSTICFFQFGALIFSVEDLDRLEEQPFIDPDDMSKLKQMERLKFTMPVRNITLKDENTLTNSVRIAIYDFFQSYIGEERLMDTLRWFIFQEYDTKSSEWTLASCPVCKTPEVNLRLEEMAHDHKFICSHCGGEIFLTDVFRLHEAVDDEMGAGGILGYVTTTIEQIILVRLIRHILKMKPALLKQFLFIKDGPLAFFGQTANMHNPMRHLVRFLIKDHNIYLAGLEKSGPFVEHAAEIADSLKRGDVLLLNNNYIYRYILPGKANPNNLYGRTTYYSSKIIFKTLSENIYVISIPTTDPEVVANPSEDDFPNLYAILTNIEKLKCDMYDDALIPVALANKLVSLANYPSSRILQRFAVEVLRR